MYLQVNEYLLIIGLKYAVIFYGIYKVVNKHLLNIT